MSISLRVIVLLFGSLFYHPSVNTLHSQHMFPFLSVKFYSELFSFFFLFLSLSSLLHFDEEKYVHRSCGSFINHEITSYSSSFT